jgi:hypothetical protein
MTALSELFTPTFLMFLGILLLVVALVVVYFESKMRDQNHKIASMLSLVSTLAEDMNGVKMGLNQVAMGQMGGQQMGGQQMGGQQMGGQQMGGQQMGIQSPPLENSNKSLYLQEVDNLIPVSDDDSDEDDESVMDDSDSDIDADSLSHDDRDSDDESSDEEEEVVKVLRLNIPAPGNNEDVGLNELEDLDDLTDEALSVSSSESSEYQLDIQSSDIIAAEEIKAETHLNISASDFKTINISLEEETGAESVDYKKLPLPKLRNIVTERGLAADAAKMKKNELLKLLEAE